MEQEKSEKNKFSSKRIQWQFISPFSLENCISRLESRTEKPTRWAWNGETRVKTEVWKIDNDSAGFKVYKAAKSSLQLDLGSGVISAKGAMFRQADGTTTVLVKAGTTTLGYVLYGLLMLALWCMVTTNCSVSLMRTSIVLAVGLSAAVLFGFIAVSLYYFDSQHTTAANRARILGG